MVLRFVLFCLILGHIVWYFIFIYAALTNSNEPQHHFHSDRHRHGWVYHVVLQKYGFIVCLISFDFYSTYYKVFIYLPCINTQRRTTALINITLVLSYIDHRTPRRYQGSSSHCEGDCNSDVICLIQPFLTIHYCNQSVLATIPDLNIYFWYYDFDIVSRSALIHYFSITCYLFV